MSSTDQLETQMLTAHRNGISAAVKPVAISEIFSSLQGEGPHLGEPHIFIRFESCHIHCAYCDELDKPACPMTLDEVTMAVKAFEEREGPHRFVSLTGGEPLLYISFIKPLIKELDRQGFHFYLETNGILVDPLLAVIDKISVVAMDIKLKSVTKEPKNYFEEHRAFLRVARRAPEVFVKMIVSPDVDQEEFLTGVGIIEREHPDIPLVLQAVTGGPVGADEQFILLRNLQMLALRYLSDVRIMPRLHVTMGIR